MDTNVNQINFQIQKRKRRLKYLRLLTKKKVEFAESAGALFLDWEWKMSACQFFTVDRSLVSGVSIQVVHFTFLKSEFDLIFIIFDDFDIFS